MDKLKNKQGFSLVEVMMGMAVFSVVAFALSATMMYTLRNSYENVMRNTAYTIAQGYLEQIQAMTDLQIERAVNSPSETPIPTRSISALSEGAIEVADPLFIVDPNATEEGENEKEIVLDIRENEDGEEDREILMTMWFDLNITRMNEGNGWFVELVFRYYAPGLGRREPTEQTLYMTRTDRNVVM